MFDEKPHVAHDLALESRALEAARRPKETCAILTVRKMLPR